MREKAATGLVVLASLLLVAATIAGYAQLAVFDSDRFADRATAALQASSVRTVVGERIRDHLPTLLAVNFYKEGDMFRVVDTLNRVDG